MSHSFVAMVTLLIPQISPLYGRWVVLFLFFSKASAHAELVVLLCRSPILFLPFVVGVGEWRGLETRWQQIDRAGHRWRCVSQAWVVETSERHVSLGPPECGFPNKTFVTKSAPPRLALDTYLLLRSQMQCVTWSINALISKGSAAKPVSKGGSGTFFFVTSSYLLSPLVFPFDPVACYFRLKQLFKIECSQTLCAERIHESSQIRLSAALHF